MPRYTGPIPSHVHGTTNGYNNWSCRCEPCKAAIAQYLREWRGARPESVDARARRVARRRFATRRLPPLDRWLLDDLAASAVAEGVTPDDWLLDAIRSKLDADSDNR